MPVLLRRSRGFGLRMRLRQPFERVSLRAKIRGTNRLELRDDERHWRAPGLVNAERRCDAAKTRTSKRHAGRAGAVHGADCSSSDDAACGKAPRRNAMSRA